MADPAGAMPTPSFASRVVCFAVPLLLFQTSLVLSTTGLLPALPLLLLPSAAARRAFLQWAGCVQEVWLAFATSLLRYGLGTEVVIHATSEEALQELRELDDCLVVSNHRTRVDWMFLWGLAAVLGRLGGLKIILKDELRKVPGFGWACQCFGFAFMTRKGREQDLATLQGTAALHVRSRLAYLLFPEGTDLSESNQAKDREFADSKGLAHYTQVLHPRTAGFVATWEAMQSLQKAGGAPPALVDVTLAYVDYSKGERPSEASLFMKGRPCREVHIYVELLSNPPASASKEALGKLCEKVFEQKEARLTRFYASSPPDAAALRWPGGSGYSVRLESAPGVALLLLRGLLTVAATEAAVFEACRRLGFLRGAALAVAAMAIFAGVCRACGGVDRQLLAHAARWPAN